MSKNNRDFFYNGSKSDVSSETIKEAPIEKAPKNTEVNERYQQPFNKKKKAKIILITKDGCIAQEPNGNNVSLYGKIYLSKAIGDEVEI